MELLFDALANELKGKPLEKRKITDGEIAELVSLAAAQKVLPLACNAVLLSCSDCISESSRILLKRLTLENVAAQTVRTDAFCALYKELEKNGLRPCVVKGIVCRELYPVPDGRPSGDEDLLIQSDQTEIYDNTLRALGFIRDETDIYGRFEVTYMRSDGLRLEVHKTLFNPDGEYCKLNGAMSGYINGRTEITAGGTSFETLTPTCHLLYLLLHAFKHFIASGFGIRQICDIALFAARYKTEIDFAGVANALKNVRADTFAAAVFNAAEQKLGFDNGSFFEILRYLPENVSPVPLLDDIMSGGIYGGDIVRQHSANVTLGAYKNAKKAGNGIIRSLFPDTEYMAEKYPYVKKNPLLLPVAWCVRAATYVHESSSDGKKTTDALKTGVRRTELLKYYGIVPEK